MRQYTVPDLECKVESRLTVPALQKVNNPYAVSLMFEEPVRLLLLQALVEDPLTAVTERCMPDVMSECDRLDQIYIEIERLADRRGNLIDIQNMFKP